MSPITAATLSAKKRVRLRSATRPSGLKSSWVRSPASVKTPAGKRPDSSPGEASAIASREDHDGGPVRGVEHDAVGGCELRGGHRHYGFELRPQTRLFLDRPAGELLDFQKDDASEGRDRVRCFHFAKNQRCCDLTVYPPLA